MALLYFTSGVNVGRKKYVCVKATNGEISSPLTILKYGVVYPAAQDDAVISGDDHTTKYLAMDEVVLPEYDSRIFYNKKTEGPDGSVWRIVHTAEKRGSEEIARAISNEEAVRRAVIQPNEDFSADITLALHAVFRRAKNLELEPDEQAAVDALSVRASKIKRNQQNRDALIFAITNGETPDIDSGWEDEQ